MCARVRRPRNARELPGPLRHGRVLGAQRHRRGGVRRRRHRPVRVDGSTALRPDRPNCADRSRAVAGDPAAALAAAEPSLGEWRADAAPSSIFNWPVALAGQAAAALGRPDAARALVSPWLEDAAAASAPDTRVLVPWTLVLIAIAAGDETSAAVDLDGALAAAVAVGVPYLVARVLLTRGMLRRRRRQLREARRALEESHSLFERLGARVWAATTRAELARLGGRRSTANALSPTEQRIAESAYVEGRTNNQVASQLFINPKTVEWMPSLAPLRSPPGGANPSPPREDLPANPGVPPGLPGVRGVRRDARPRPQRQDPRRRLVHVGGPLLVRERRSWPTRYYDRHHKERVPLPGGGVFVSAGQVDQSDRRVSSLTPTIGGLGRTSRRSARPCLSAGRRGRAAGDGRAALRACARPRRA